MLSRRATLGQQAQAGGRRDSTNLQVRATSQVLNIAAILALGFVLGMRHATDPDHVVAVSAIVAREKTLRAAAPVGALWGVGHTLTILLVGGAVLVFGVVIPPRLGLGMEFSVALMLMLLGALNVRRVWVESRARREERHEHLHHGDRRLSAARALVVGVVHGLAGSAAVALLVLGAIREVWWGVCYLVVFGAGTIAGMLLVTVSMAWPIVAAGQRFSGLHRALGGLTGLASLGFGALLAYRIGFVDGLFAATPHWSPH